MSDLVNPTKKYLIFEARSAEELGINVNKFLDDNNNYEPCSLTSWLYDNGKLGYTQTFIRKTSSGGAKHGNIKSKKNQKEGKILR
jgi:hypothetical protein